MRAGERNGGSGRHIPGVALARYHRLMALKRTELRRSTKPLQRKMPLRSTSSLKRSDAMSRGSGGAVAGSGGVASPLPRKPVNRVSKRRQVLNRELAAVVAEKRKTVRFCQAQPLIKAALSHPDNTEADRRRYVEALQACRCSEPTIPHHVLKRSRGSDQTLTDGANIILVCAMCDSAFIEREYVLATRAGLLEPSWFRSRVLGRIA